MSTIAVLLMVKNEKISIKNTIDSFKRYIDVVIVLDTGSTDNTIDIIKKTCENNKQKLYLKKTVFKSFPESRNESIEFAESVSDATFFLLMDAGDELKTHLSSKINFINAIKTIPNNYNFGLVRHNWLNNGSLEDHFDARFIRNKNKCRYDIRYPVHEKFDKVSNDLTNLSDIFYLYQDRDKYGVSTQNRYLKDIEMLSNAIQNKRNLYYFGQTYLNMSDFENGFKYNLLSYEKEIDDDEFGDHIIKNILVRIGYCAMKSNKSKKIVFEYLTKAIENFIEPPIEAFIFLFSYSIEQKITNDVMIYVPKLFELKKPTGPDLTIINHGFYDYKRWNLISIVCLLSNQHIELGKKACQNALKVANNPDDRNNMQIYNYISKN